MSTSSSFTRALDEVSYFQSSKADACASRGTQCDRTHERRPTTFRGVKCMESAAKPVVKIEQVRAKPPTGAKPM